MQTLTQLLAGELSGAKSIKIAAGLTHIPPEIIALADTLELLDLSGNKLSSLPEDFGLLKNLKILFLSDNEFTQYPEVLKQCPNLEMIGFKANKIQNIPAAALTENIRWLILTNNNIAELPASIGKCKRLQKCMLAGNKLQNLPPALANCHNLELLRISANQFTELPDWLFAMPRLSWLAYGGNPFSKNIPLTNTLPVISWEQLALKEQLGQGASGIITKAAWQTENKTKPVAVKVFKGEVTSDGLPADEMNACVAAGRHPNIVAVLGKIQAYPAQKQGLVLELIPPDYHNLGNPPSYATCTRDTYPANTAFTLPEILTIATGIASAAAHLHARGIMHGDLYAHNILINAEAHPLFGDFGAATLYDRTDAEKATYLERLEVRAFGCLIEDLTNLLAPSEVNAAGITQLLSLKTACMYEIPAKRPGFPEIGKQLMEIALQLK